MKLVKLEDNEELISTKYAQNCNDGDKMSYLWIPAFSLQLENLYKYVDYQKSDCQDRNQSCEELRALFVDCLI